MLLVATPEQTRGREPPALQQREDPSHAMRCEPQFAWVDLGADFSLDECRAIRARDPTTLVPAMTRFTS